MNAPLVIGDSEPTFKRNRTLLRVTLEREASTRCRDCSWQVAGAASSAAGSAHAAYHRHEVVLDYYVRYAYRPRADV